MDATITIIENRILGLRVEIEQNKKRSRWGLCNSLSGGISELQGLIADLKAFQQLNEAKP